MNRRPPRPLLSGFTLVEILIAAVIGVAVVTAGVVGFGIMSELSTRTGTINVELTQNAIADLYGANSTFISIAPSPNYYQGVQARLLKDRLTKDAAAGTAVFCLGRNFRGSPADRPLTLTVDGEPSDFRDITSPDAFRDAFEAELGNFPSGQDGALSWATNASIFVLGTLTYNRNTDNNLKVIAVYEIDFLPVSQPSAGTFASVRRFSGSNNVIPSDFYHAFYPDENDSGSGFRPLAAFFPRAATGAGSFAVASNHPFSFVWWPDPLTSRLEGSAVPSAAGVPSSYANMANRTGLFFVLPAFPPL